MTGLIENLICGTWLQIYANENGSIIDKTNEITTKIDSENFQVFDKNKQLIIAGCYKIHADQRPASIDWFDTYGDDKGSSFLAIFEVSENGFVFCAADSGMKRPKSFIEKQGHTLRRFVRIQD